MKPTRRHLLLAVVATDATFQRTLARGQDVWVGRCLHCNTRLVIAADGTPDSGVTLEHIVPQHHGGTDDLRNLGLACARCNQGKGTRHDHKPKDDPRLREVVALLQARRIERWRDPREVPDAAGEAARRLLDPAETGPTR